MSLNISKYDFHDGCLFDVVRMGTNLELSMESAQIDPDDLREEIELSKNRTIKGKLHIRNIIKINTSQPLVFHTFNMESEEGDIHTFNIRNNKVFLRINWIGDFSTKIADPWVMYEIEAKEIYWENIPDLYNPFL